MAVDAAAGVDRSGWSGAAKSEAVLALLGAQERLAALVTAVVGEWDADQSWALDGSLSPVAWLAHRAGIPMSQVMTIGDAFHALERLSDAGHGVAMASAPVEAPVRPGP